MAQSTKLKLDNDELAEDFFDETSLLGIVAPLKDFQFCWQLNQFLQYDFRINNDLEIQLHKKQRHYYFSIYQFEVPATSLVHYLYNNQHDGEYLLPEFKHLDFLWLLKGDVVDPAYLNELIQSLRGIASVQMVTELTNEKIKNKSHLIF